MKGLTSKQQEILDFIAQFARQEGMAPTIYEISEHFDIKSATAFAHVRALQRKGFVNRSSKARSLSLVNTEKPKHFSLTLSIPVLGHISAGAPLLSEEHVECKVIIDPSLLPRGVGGHKLFGLRVQGESMRDLGILDGDLVIAKQTEEASIGDHRDGGRRDDGEVAVSDGWEMGASSGESGVPLPFLRPGGADDPGDCDRAAADVLSGAWGGGSDDSPVDGDSG